MSKKPRKSPHQLSVTAETYAKLKARADARGVPIGLLIAEMLGRAERDS